MKRIFVLETFSYRRHSTINRPTTKVVGLPLLYMFHTKPSIDRCHSVVGKKRDSFFQNRFFIIAQKHQRSETKVSKWHPRLQPPKLWVNRQPKLYSQYMPFFVSLAEWYSSDKISINSKGFEYLDAWPTMVVSQVIYHGTICRGVTQQIQEYKPRHISELIHSFGSLLGSFVRNQCWNFTSSAIGEVRIRDAGAKQHLARFLASTSTSWCPFFRKFSALICRLMSKAYSNWSSLD